MERRCSGMRNIDKEIAELILRSQNASDGGKGIIELVSKGKSVRDNRHGYAGKDQFIFLAISMIVKGKSSFHFAVTDGGFTPYLVYFETRISGKKFQVSFHSFDRRLERFKGKSFRIKWDHGSSRDSAATIYRHYCPCGQYAG